MLPCQTKPAEDAMSEISDASTTGTGRSCCSSECREELQELAISLGLNSADDLHRDRFKIDRRKLENMILGSSDRGNAAQDFFQKIMNETRTLILWPSRLKIGAKSKKDPHVNIAGLLENVAIAKQRVMSALDNRGNRVTMKLDISYTDHSHIIGKGGLRIKRVMEETCCHIHFPDSNRNNQEEKSNQVSIAGEMAAIEKARARLRELTPLIFCFELPNVGTLPTFPDLTSPTIVSVQEIYNVQVMFRTRAKLHSTLVVVKGCEWEVERVKEATLRLINHLCDVYANQVSVQMIMEISPQYHSLVLGAGHQNLKTIMQRTGVRVMFPDANDPNTPSLKKSTVTITGTIDSVYLARQMLIGSLPLVLMFEIMPETISLNPGFLDDLMHSLDVYVSIRHKPKQNILSVVIKGLERNATGIYEARRRLLGSKEKVVTAEIPQNYIVPGNVPTFLRSISAGSAFPNMVNVMIGNGSPGSSLPPMARSSPIYSPLAHQNEMAAACFGGLPHHLLGGGSPQFQHRMAATITSNGSPHSHMNPSNILQQRLSQRSNGFSEQAASNVHHAVSTNSYNGFMSSSDPKDFQPYSSLSSATTSSFSSPTVSPRTASPLHISSALDLNDERRAPGFERSVGGLSSDFQQLRVQAVQAMQQEPNKSQIRTPTRTWSGYGFSQSSPSSIGLMRREQKADENANTEDSAVTNGNENRSENLGVESVTYSCSDYLDSTNNSTLNAVTSSNYSDLPSQLASLGLEKYIQLFKTHEIDITTFTTLTDTDLKEIGVTALGARRKLLLFIAELKKREYANSYFQSSVAPGAERKNMSPRTDRW